MKTKEQRLFELANTFASSVAYRCVWNHLDDFRKCRAHPWWRAFRDDPCESYRSFAEEEDRFADTYHRCMTAILDEWRELHALVADMAPQLYGMLPVFELGEARPPDDTFAQLAQGVKALIGELLCLKKSLGGIVPKTNTPESPALTDVQIRILHALKRLRANDQDSRQTASQLCQHVDPLTKPTNLKEPLAALKRMHIIDSLGSGRNGGYWLTEVGKSRLAQIRKVRKR